MQTMLAEDGTVRAVIHFAVGENGRLWRTACGTDLMTGKGDPRTVLQYTNEARAVTCGMCQQTQKWKDARANR